jgi:glycosyltransferase involved in cell wall biosynthesis
LIIASKVRLALKAVQLKLRLLTAYDTFWPAMARGSRLILNGRVGEFTRKLFNELPDARDAQRNPPVVRSGPPLFLAGHILGLGGYDHLVLNILKGLTSTGVNICGDRRSCFRKQLVPPDIRPTELPRRNHPRLAVVPPHLLYRYRPDSHTAVFTMWETDTLPRNGIKHLNRSRLVIVPSRWGAACFRANGVSAPIVVVPLGYDPEVFQPLMVPTRSSVCTFGTAGALDEGGLRKNVQRTIDLFRQTFPKETNVRLRVKITPQSPPVHTGGDGRIEVLNSPLSPEALAEWYRSLDAFVNASAGEGFGLHLLEAMACGVPLISTTFGGVGAFFDSRVGYEVGYKLVEARNAIYRGKWADPNDDELMDGMRRVYGDRAGARQRGGAAAIRALGFRWEDTIRKLVIVLIQNGFIRPG